jgi:menaquinone-dependent protoporphyrinogen oxidase
MTDREAADQGVRIAGVNREIDQATERRGTRIRRAHHLTEQVGQQHTSHLPYVSRSHRHHEPAGARVRVGGLGRAGELSPKGLWRLGPMPLSMGERQAETEAEGLIDRGDDMTVLVGYASEHGSTQGIAERIAARIGEHGSQVEVRSLDQIEDADDYDAVVLGSAVHNGSWLPEGTRFVRRNHVTLAERPVWLFSVGLARALGGRAEAHAKEPKEIPRFREAIHPRDHHLFAGALGHDDIPPMGRMIWKVMGGRYGDFRNWEEIDAWAEGIARHLSTTQQKEDPDRRRICSQLAET